MLSRGRRLYSTRRLREACRERGHEVVVLDTMRFAIDVEQGDPRLFFRGRRLRDYDALIPRIGASISFFGTAVVRQFEQMGVFCLNPSHAISVSRDKLRSIQVMSRHRLGFPRTVFAKDKRDVMAALDQVGMPAVIKLLEGTQGVGVILAENRKMAEAIMEALQEGAKQNVLVQEFVAESRGRDIRAIVVGDRVVAAMRRTAKGDEFRSNVHRGGDVEAVELDDEYRRTAVHAAQVMGLRFAGVDMLEGKGGPLVMEVNSSPGLEGIERATGVDVAREVVWQIEDEVLLPDFDIRQRLTLRNGYGVTEVPILPHSELCGRTIQECGLRERDAIVLSIHRDSVTIPNPSPERELLTGDVLLCYGKLLTLKSLVPQEPQRRRRRRKAAPVVQVRAPSS
ncbi:MAG: RimK family alpha-L-glutamate ligase [Planctomycetota bacterium]